MFKSLVYSLITRGTVALINFFILVISSRYLGVSSRGEISIFILNITIIQVINEVYTGYSIVHFIPKYDLRKIAAYGFCYSVLFCSLSNLIVCFLNKQVAGNEWLGYLVSLLVILNTFNCVIILGRENIRIYNLLSFLQPLLLLLGIGFYIFVLQKYTFESYIYPLLVSFIIAFFISLYTVSVSLKKHTSISTFELRPILASGFVFQSATLMFIFVNRYSYYLLPDIANVGLYSSASALMESALIVVNGISPVLLARVANLGNNSRSVDMTLALGKVGFVFTLLTILLLVFLPDSFFVLVLGEGFSGIRDLMIIYAPGVLMVSLFSAIGSYFSATNRQRIVLMSYGLGFISTLILAPLLISRYKVAGAAYNANIAYLLITVAMCSCFIVANKLGVKRFFSFRVDYSNLKQLLGPRQA